MKYSCFCTMENHNDWKWMYDITRPVLFNLCDGTHQCGWENRAVRMTNTVRIKKPCSVVVNVFLKSSLYNHLMFFCKTWYCTQRKVDTHCAHIVIIRTSQQKCIRSYWQLLRNFYPLVPLLCNDGNDRCATARQSWAHINYLLLHQLHKTSVAI